MLSPLFRAALSARRAMVTPLRVPVRRSGGGHHAVRYRQATDPDPYYVRYGMFLSSFMWFWIFWHMWHTPEEVFGHFPYPDPSKWTNEELGIPPDDEE
ncbi:unnamed protein product [Lampetra planeri]